MIHEKQDSPNHGLLLTRLALAAGCVWMAGCAAVDPDPFAKYSSAVREAQSGIDSAMSVNYNWTRSGFVDGFASNPDSKFSGLMIQPGEGYDWALPEQPVYLKVREARNALSELNAAFAKYADLLARLSSRDLVSTAKFDQIAKDLNKNAGDALKALNMNAPAEGVAIFSIAASEAARLYIENRRRHHLRDAIRENQANVAAYSELCVSLLHTIRGDIKAYYAARTEPIKNGWNSSTGEKRQKNTEAMLDLNDQYADAMRVLRELERAYEAFPGAHADLAKAVEKPKGDLDEIQNLYSSAKRLQQLYQGLKKPEKG